MWSLEMCGQTNGLFFLPKVLQKKEGNRTFEVRSQLLEEVLACEEIIVIHLYQPGGDVRYDRGLES